MSEQPTEETSETTPPEGTEQQSEAKTFDAEYVEKLRKEAAKYRTEAKANSEAAKRLAEIEEANKSEVQKAADRLAAAEKAAQEARNEALRYRIATEFALSPDDAAALEHVSSEDGMRLVAERLKAKSDERRQNGNLVPREGNNPPANQDQSSALFARSLFSPGE